MKRREIKQLLKDVLGKNVQMQDAGGWVSVHCPLAKWTHQRGTDNSMSAGVSVKDNGTSIFSCYACKTKGPIHYMLREYARYSKKPELLPLIEELEEEAYLGGLLPAWGEVPDEEVRAELVALDESIYMDLYDPAAGHPYLRKRGISDATAESLEIMFDPADSEGEPRIVFPVRGYDGSLYGFTGRATEPTARLKVRDYYGLPKKRCLLGAHRLKDADKILVCEGLFDYAVLAEYGYYPAATMHSSLQPEQAEILIEAGKPVYVFFDNDEAGAQGQNILTAQLINHLPLLRVKYPKVWIDDESEEGGGHWLKDPGELEPDEVEAMIRTARLI